MCNCVERNLSNNYNVLLVPLPEITIVIGPPGGGGGGGGALQFLQIFQWMKLCTILQCNSALSLVVHCVVVKPLL